MKKYLLGLLALVALLLPSTTLAAYHYEWPVNPRGQFATPYQTPPYLGGLSLQTTDIQEIVDLRADLTNLQQQVASLTQQVNAMQMSQNPVGGYPEQPVVVQNQVDLTPRMDALEKRVGYLEMALDYFNGYVSKFKSALKIK